MAEVIEKSELSETRVESKRIDYGRALTWFFSDPNFGKVLLVSSLYWLSCILIFPIFYVGPLMLGYIFDLIKNIQNEVWELPELGAEGQWQRGIMYSIVQFLMAFLIIFIFILLVLGFSFLFENASESTQIILAFIGTFLYIAFILGISLLSYFQFLIFAKTSNVASMFSVDNLGYVVKKNILPMIIFLIILSIAANIYPVVGMIACGVGILPAIMILYMTVASLLGQFDVDGVE